MNIVVTIQLDNLPDATDLEAVHDTIRRQVVEHLDFDRHPHDMRVDVEEKPCPSST